MNVLVVGAGEMGRWFARALATGLDESPSVAFADADPAAAESAAATLSSSDPGAMESAVDARAVPTDTNARFDLVCVAVPIPAVESVVAEYADRADRAMVDVAGVMAGPVRAMADAVPEKERVSLHPLFAGSSAPGNVAVVPDAPGPVTDRVREALDAAGNDLFETTPEEHDRAMETVQARVHAAILAFGLAAEDVPEEFGTPNSTALFDLLERVTGNDPRVYADIQETFAGAEDVAAAARQLAEADRETFEQLYREANPAARSEADTE